MADQNYNVRILVDVEGKKVMDELAKGAGGAGPALPGTTKKTLAEKEAAEKKGPAEHHETMQTRLEKLLFGGANKEGKTPWDRTFGRLPGGEVLGKAAKGVIAGEGLEAMGGVMGVVEALVSGIGILTAVVGIVVGLLIMGIMNSQVIARLMSTLGKLMGFLVDVILMPFMPIFMTALMWLYQLILAIRNWQKTVAGGLKFILELAGAAADWCVKLIQKFIEIGWATLMASLSIGLVIVQTIVDWIVNLIKWAYGAGQLTRSLLELSMSMLLSAVTSWFWSVVKWAFGAVALTNSLLSITLGAIVSGISGWIQSILQWVFGWTSTTNGTITIKFLSNMVGWIWDFVKALWDKGLGYYNLWAPTFGLPTLEKGGTVEKTGLAVVHEGETYSGVGGGKAGGGNTYQFNYYGRMKDEYELFQAFLEFMKRHGESLNL